MIEFFKVLFNWLKEQGPAIGILIFNWKEAQRQAAEAKQKQAELELKIEKNHEQVDKDNVGVSDSAGVDKIAGPRE